MSTGRWGAPLGAVVAGAVAGTLVLGIGGRVVMRLIAVWLLPGEAGFSWAGTLEVLAAGGLFGAVAALLWVPLARRLPSPAVGPALGVATCAGIAALSSTARNAGRMETAAAQLAVVALFLALCVAYGLVAHALARRWTA